MCWPSTQWSYHVQWQYYRNVLGTPSVTYFRSSVRIVDGLRVQVPAIGERHDGAQQHDRGQYPGFARRESPAVDDVRSTAALRRRFRWPPSAVGFQYAAGLPVGGGGDGGKPHGLRRGVRFFLRSDHLIDRQRSGHDRQRSKKKTETSGQSAARHTYHVRVRWPSTGARERDVRIRRKPNWSNVRRD